MTEQQAVAEARSKAAQTRNTMYVFKLENGKFVVSGWSKISVRNARWIATIQPR